MELETGSRIGIMPFAERVVKPEGPDKLYKSPELKLGGIGTVIVSVSVPDDPRDMTAYLEDGVVYVLKEDGRITAERARNALKKRGYGDLGIDVYPATEDFNEMRKKGDVDCLIWTTDSPILKGELKPVLENSYAGTFGPETSKLPRKTLWVPTNDSFLRKLNIAFKSKHEEVTN